MVNPGRFFASFNPEPAATVGPTVAAGSGLNDLKGWPGPSTRSAMTLPRRYLTPARAAITAEAAAVLAALAQ